MTSTLTTYGSVQLITGKKHSKFPYCNSIFIEEAGLIIDPSCNGNILKELHRSGKIKNVCLTHWHEDHFRYLHLLDNCDLWVSEKDAVPLGCIEKFMEWYGIDGTEGKDLNKIIRHKMESEIHFKARVPDKLLQDGDILELGSVSIEVIASPGHSPGHLSFFFREPKILFLGDYNLDSFGPWTGDPYSDIDQCIQTIHRLRQVPAEILITGHRPTPITDDPSDYWDRYLGAIAKREKKILKFLSKPRSINTIIDQWIVLGKAKEPIEYFRFGEKAHIKKHLRRLLKQGQIAYQGGYYHCSN
ncbi:MBL fold metallo-hydrolase [bacterium]|nr:MBL fold metallo-hydrolase [bacterium]